MRTSAILGLLGLMPVLAVPSISQTEEFSYVHGGVVMRVESTEDDKVWTTHTGGTIRYSTDGGTTFTNASVPTTVTRVVRGIQISSDAQGSYGYCVGAEGVVLFSTDEGQSWTFLPEVLNRFGDPANLWDVFFADRDNGWIVGFDHTIMETDDGGQTWTDIAPIGHVSSANPEWYQIEDLADDEWIAVADNGWLVRRLPNGSMPSRQLDYFEGCYMPQIASMPFDLELWSVDFVGDFGLIAGGIGNNDGYVWESSDRGATWTLHTACYDYLDPAGDGNTPPSFYGVEMFGDPQGGVVAGYASGVYRSGISSTAVAPDACTTCPPASLALTQVVADSDDNLTVEATDDGGRPLMRDIGSSESFQVGWTVGDFGHVRRSDDGGTTWQEKAGLHRGRIRGGEFANMQTGVLFGQNWRTFWTDDGGQNFELEYAATIPAGISSGNFRAAAITPDGTRAVVVGERGRIAVRDNLGQWTDRSIGQWTSDLTLTAVIASPDASVILTVGNQGTIFLSSNNGVTFGEFTLNSSGVPVTANLLDMTLVNGLVLYLAADQTVYVTQAANFANSNLSLPIVGATAQPTVMGASAFEVYVGNAIGEVYALNPTTTQLELVTALDPSDLGGRVHDIERAPGTFEWFVSGQFGFVQHFDGTAWSEVKSSIGEDVYGLEFFSPTEGLVIGRKTSIGVW